MKNDSGWATFARYFSVAMLLPISSLVGYGIGTWLDHALATHFLAMTCMILGTVGGFIQLIRELTKG